MSGVTGKLLKFIPVLVLIFIAVLIAALAIGSVSVPFKEVASIILNNVGLTGDSSAFTDSQESIVFYVRLPRVLQAALVGAALAVCGTVMQGIFRNPMADPGILGVSSGAGLGAVISIASGLQATSIYFTPAFASIGALGAAFLIFALSSRRGKIPVINMILSGMAVSMFLSAITTFILSFVSGDQVKQYMFWTVGSFNSSRWENIRLIAVPILVCMACLRILARDLNIMMLGEEEAQSVGVNTSGTRILLLIFASIATAAAVSVSGTISFVGLIVPHILRILTGPDHRVLIPVSALGGAIFLVLCDMISRVAVIPEEINVGIVTSILGAPYFLYLLNSAKKKGRSM